MSHLAGLGDECKNLYFHHGNEKYHFPIISIYFVGNERCAGGCCVRLWLLSNHLHVSGHLHMSLKDVTIFKLRKEQISHISDFNPVPSAILHCHLPLVECVRRTESEAQVPPLGPFCGYREPRRARIFWASDQYLPHLPARRGSPPMI